jgi:hypothetical protein
VDYADGAVPDGRSGASATLKSRWGVALMGSLEIVDSLSIADQASRHSNGNYISPERRAKAGYMRDHCRP